MTNNPNGFQREIKIKGQRLEEVENYKYLGAIISNEGSKPEILSRIAQTTAALSRQNIIWRDKNISLASKVKLMRTLILSTFLSQQNPEVHDDLLTMIKKRKLRRYGHISRSSGMAKTILQRTVKGARRRGRQKKSWEDNIKEWTGMGFGNSMRAAEDREGWEGILQRHCGAPTTSKVKGLRWDKHILTLLV